MLGYCVESKIDEAYQILKSLWDKGYSQHDIITNIFRVCKNHQMPEYLKLEFIKVKMLFCYVTQTKEDSLQPTFKHKLFGFFNSNPNYWHQLSSIANISTTVL